jgi:cobalt-zinc-cadmium efflux system membrane fusion protein
MNDSTVLLVDDDEVLGQVLRRVLTRQGCQVVQAGSVAQALQAAREQCPRVALLDLCLPDGDGVELAERLVEECGPLPVVLMTAYPLRLRDHPELAHRFRRVLTKPLNLEELRQTIESALAETGAPLPPPAAPNTKRQADRTSPVEAPSGSEAEVPVPATVARQHPDEPVGHPAHHPAGSVLPPPKRRRAVLIPTLLGLTILAAGTFLVLPNLGVKGIPNLLEMVAKKPEETAEQSAALRLLDPQHPDRFEASTETLGALHVGAPHQVPAGARPRQLELSGSLAFDTNTLGRLQSRFAGEVVALGTNEQGGLDPATGLSDRNRPVKFGDTVKKDQLLAVVWSKDLGEKKSELVDALSQLVLDQDTLDRLEALYREGNTSEAAVRQARRNVSGDLTAVNRAERTLRTWRLSESEIEEIRAESRRILARKGKHDPDKEKNWARVEVRAPFDGVIAEKNVNVGRMVDPSFDLFAIARVDELAVYINAYEEELRLLHSIRHRYPGGIIPWQVYLNSDPSRTPLESRGIEQIGLVIDPNQRTALVIGHVANPPDRTERVGRLQAGQFVTAVVTMPPPDDVVSIPTSAVVEDGRESVVFVQPDPKQPRFQRKRVVVVARYENTMNVRSRLTEEELKKGLSPITPGEWIVTEGSLPLKAALEEAIAFSRNPTDKQPTKK